MHVGILRSGEAQSEIIPKLQIITQEQYDRVAKGRTRHKTLCNGPTSCRAKQVDAVVETLLRNILEKTKSINEWELVQRQVQETASQCGQKLRKAQVEHTRALRK